MRLGGILSCFVLLPSAALAQVRVATCKVVSPAGASAMERHAASELQSYLSQITEAPVGLVLDATDVPPNSILVGARALARKLAPDVDWSKVGGEQVVIRSQDDRLLVSGGSTRGTLYGVYRLLQKSCGVRWWAPWATTVPHNPRLTFRSLNWSESPAFEFRDPYWFHSFDADWAARNFDNGTNTRIDAERGGKTVYEGFVHTYDGLVPPKDYFGPHPEWYSLINGKRTFQNAQLCTTNPELKDFVVEQVRKRLRVNPAATIVSVSQNDCFNPCQCDNCRALVAKEGSEAALTLSLANYVADKIKDEFPAVAVDTLAYQWSRHPTKEIRPRANVIVRLCSIECDFAVPLYAPQNKAFASDIEGWNRLTNRLYVWDYCTDFLHYLQPQPDYFSLGKTLGWFAKNGVKGVFEEGAYNSNGADMAELKAWVIAQMLWDPKQNPDRLVDEFLKGYYGPAAGPVRQYLRLMDQAAQTSNVTFAMGNKAPYLDYEAMSKAEKCWAEAKRRTVKMPEYAARVRMSSLSPESMWLAHWRHFREEALKRGDPWPMAATRAEQAQKWLADCASAEILKGYGSVSIISEGGQTPKSFVDGLGPEPVIKPAQGK